MTLERDQIDVSVIIAAWNAEATLAAAAQSALTQAGVTVEVFIVDDASPDGTGICGAGLADAYPNVIFLSQSKNKGPAAARNLALSKARGRYVTVLDSDDMMEPGRLKALVDLAHDNDADAVADDLWRVDAADPNGPRRRLLSQDMIGWQDIGLVDFIYGNMTSANGARGEMGFLKPLILRSFLTEHDISYDEDMRLGEDYMLYAQMLGRGAVVCLTDPLGYLAIMRGDSLSARHSTGDLGAMVAADLALQKEFGKDDDVAAALQMHLIDTKKRWRWMCLIDAVKQRDIGQAVRCFTDHPKVSLFLIACLWEQVVLRSRRKWGRT